MKKVLLLIAVLWIPAARLLAQSGIASRDAATLLADLGPDAKDTELKELIEIISYYSGRKDLTAANIDAQIATMPFLKDYRADVAKVKNRLAAAISPEIYATPTGGVSGVLGSNVTDIADGIAKFLIKRGKQELSTAFFEKFRADLKKYPELAIVFPQTSSVIANLDITNYDGLLQSLKDAFSKDLLKIPGNLLALRNLTTAQCDSKDQDCINRVNHIQLAFTSSAGYDPRALILPLIAMQGLVDGDNVIDIADKLSAEPTVCSQADDLSGLIKLSSILLESLRTDDNGGGLFIDQNQLKTLFYSNDQLKIFFGLVYQKYHRLDCYNNLAVNGKALDAIFSDILNVQIRFYTSLSAINKINYAYTAIKKSVQQGQKIDFANASSAIAASLQSLTDILNSVSTVTGAPGLPVNYAAFLKNLNTAANICNDVQQRNYSGLFTGAIKIVTDNHIFSGKNQEKLVSYLSFAANLASATNSDEVESAIETVALPPGSYSIKQKAALNLSLNGYIGYSWDFNKVAKDLYANGIYAPVGFTISTSLSKKFGGSLSLFSSLIDVGNVASYRLKASATGSLKQDVRLESIVSPSAQLIIGLPKLPLSLCAGWRMTPKLFYEGPGTFMPVPARSVFNLAVLIDIPIFTLYNKPLN